MQSETCTVQQLFQNPRQYRVPFYQRAYVWTKEEQWQPLWEDILEKAETRFLGNEPTPHFLGAIVLERQKRESLRGVETFNVIDGQQRLSTLQYIFAALTLVLRSVGEKSIISLVKDCLWNLNRETMEQPEIEVFKVWPTFRDRDQYVTAMRADSLDELRAKFPDSFTQTATLKKIGIRHPRTLEAIWFFHNQILRWSTGDTHERLRRFEAIANAIFRDIKFVSIMLQDEDDAQVIFETLNGRGAELHATDLIRNFIFMRADREAADAAKLYDDLWLPFEEDFWSDSQRRGRLLRPRLEWFVQTMLQAELGEETEIGTLYVAYKRYAIGRDSFVPAETQLRSMSHYADKYRQLVTGEGKEPIAEFGKRIAIWDASPTHSLALHIACADLSPDDQSAMFNSLLSYLIRRAVCGLTNKNYNNVFLQVLKRLADNDLPTSSTLRTILSALKGDASRWPGDEEFKHAWLTKPAISSASGSHRVKTILAAIENNLRTKRTEEPFTGDLSKLDVDHIMPMSWYKHWPLDGKPVDHSEASGARLAQLYGQASSPHQEAIMRREMLKESFGNLTIVHYGVNRALQNHAFGKKRKALFNESNLHLNRTLMQIEEWDEALIEKRGSELFDHACSIWRGPE